MIFKRSVTPVKIIIGVGLPTMKGNGICISMILFSPGKARQTYSKKYIHPDEEEFFVRGESPTSLVNSEPKIALAICYELSVPAHSENAFACGAEIYIASVAKSAKGVESATKSLSDIARRYSMNVLMSNCIGPCDDFESVGNSSAWTPGGKLAGQLNEDSEGILMLDTMTQNVIKKTI